MSAEWVRNQCLGFPYTTEGVQWGNHLVFKVGGKIYAIAALDPEEVWLSFKCSAENFAELPERVGIVPAPYMARAQWVALESRDAVAPAELAGLLREAYELVFTRLPKKARAELQARERAAPGPAHVPD